MLSRTGLGVGEAVRQQADAPLGAHQRRPAGRQACRAVPAARETSLAVAAGALLGVLCSATRRAPCAWHASPAAPTYSHLHAIRLVLGTQRAGCPMSM